MPQERKAEIAQMQLKLQGKHTRTKKLLLSEEYSLGASLTSAPLLDPFTDMPPSTKKQEKISSDGLTFSPIGQAQVSFLDHIAYDMDFYTDASDKGLGAYWAKEWFNSTWKTRPTANSMERDVYICWCM